MAIGTIPPWVTGPNVVGETASGASAGAAAGHLEQNNRFESARLKMEAERMQQSAALAQAQLQQAAQQHEMEFSARQKLAEQNQLRLQQQLNIQNAYKTAALGIAKGRLEETQLAASEKAKTAAMQFQREQAFAQDVANGVPVMEAYRRNPVSPSLLGATERTQLKEGAEAKPVLREGKFPLIEYNPKTGETRQVYTPPKPEGLSTADKEDLKDLREERKDIKKKMGDSLSERIAPTPPEQRKANEDRLNALNQQIESIKRGTKSSSSPESKSAHPKVGEVRFGYRFKGGDPNATESWEPVKEGE
jgi:hypothetical protein